MTLLLHIQVQRLIEQGTLEDLPAPQLISIIKQFLPVMEGAVAWRYSHDFDHDEMEQLLVYRVSAYERETWDVLECEP